MGASQRDVESHATRLAGRLGDLEPYRLDPAFAISANFGITVEYRAEVDSGCDIDGSYHHELKTIRIAQAASLARRRFTALHELAHALGRTDSELQDWLFGFEAAGRIEEERVANAFAAEVLLPKAIVDDHLPDIGPCAWDVVQLAAASTASREAVCVRASQRLRGPGMVVLAQGSVVRFSATHSLPFRVPRGTDQGPDSFFARASEHGQIREAGVRLRFPNTDLRSDALMADAYADADGYVYVVLMEHSAPWQALTPPASSPDGFEIECEECDRVRITWARGCPVCGDRPCPDHGCSCTRAARRGAVRRCKSCNIQLPAAVGPDVEVCEMCG